MALITRPSFAVKREAMTVVFNIQRFSVEDGPGIRTTVFIKGCPLRCVWCSNPESQKDFPEVAHRDSLCTKCGSCVEVCEVHACSVTAKGTRIDRRACARCGKCVDACAPGARIFYGEEMSVDEVFKEVLRDKPFYQNSGGGVSVCGGEPLTQPEFVAELFKRCQEADIHTCLDTCGYADPSAWELVLPYTKLVLFDLKLIDPAAHLKVTGKSNEKILRSLELVAGSGVPVIVRVPVIPGINDSEESIAEIARHVASLGSLRDVSLLAYHRYGENKYQMLDRRYRLGKLTPPDDNQLERLAGIVRSFGLSAEIQR
jgi:pyruvate formate lyase activating enzyme